MVAKVTEAKRNPGTQKAPEQNLLFGGWGVELGQNLQTTSVSASRYSSFRGHSLPSLAQGFPLCLLAHLSNFPMALALHPQKGPKLVKTPVTYSPMCCACISVGIIDVLWLYRQIEAPHCSYRASSCLQVHLLYDLFFSSVYIIISYWCV